MNDPIAEIPSAINACAAASTADSQIAAFHKYCLPTTSFLHPMCYVASGSNSLEKVIEIYQFYRSVIPATSFEVLSVAFDEQKGQLFVKLVQRPKLRFTPGWLRVELPMLICFTVVKREEDGDGEGRWFIGAIEDFVQPMHALTATPIGWWFGVLVYLFFQLGGRFMGRVYRLFGIWKPTKRRVSE